MEEPIVILDACVLFPASTRDLLLRLAGTDIYRLQWTEAILEEVRRNLANKGKLSDEKVAHLMTEMHRAFADNFVTEYEHLMESMTNHPKDRHVLAAAVVAKAQIIMTFNLRDFPPSALEPFGIIAQSPDQFLLTLLHTQSEVIKAVIAKQALQLKNPPKTIADILKSLAIHVPDFVKAFEALDAQA